jgi:hypothetical protein
MKLNQAWVIGVALLGACATSSPQKNTSSVADVDDPPSPRCSSSDGGDHLLVVGNRDGYALSLPGKDWKITCSEEKLFFAESSRGMYVSVRAYDPGGPVELPAYLTDIAMNVGGHLHERGFGVSEPRAVNVQVEDKTAPAIFLMVDLDSVEPNTAQLNYWTARQRSDGVMLDFHVSMVVPTDLTREETNALLDAMERAAGLFDLLEEPEPASVRP